MLHPREYGRPCTDARVLVHSGIVTLKVTSDRDSLHAGPKFKELFGDRDEAAFTSILEAVLSYVSLLRSHSSARPDPTDSHWSSIIAELQRQGLDNRQQGRLLQPISTGICEADSECAVVRGFIL